MNNKVPLEENVQVFSVSGVPLEGSGGYSSAQQTGIFELQFLSPDCCVECWQCCICCWLLPQPQPEVRSSVMVEIDGAEMGKMYQGQHSSWVFQILIHHELEQAF